jgi:hypothetical protein
MDQIPDGYTIYLLEGDNMSAELWLGKKMDGVANMEEIRDKFMWHNSWQYQEPVYRWEQGRYVDDAGRVRTKREVDDAAWEWFKKEVDLKEMTNYQAVWCGDPE